MPSSIKLKLTDDLREFIDRNCGDGTLFVTPGESIRDLIRKQKRQAEASQVRDAILEGYGDAIAGRLIPFGGDLRRLLKQSDG